jgi:hypothetical protein
MRHRLTLTSALVTIGLLSAVLFVNLSRPGVVSAQTTTAATLRRESVDKGIWWWFSPVEPGTSNKPAAVATDNTSRHGKGGKWASGSSREWWERQAKEDIRARMNREWPSWSPVQGTFKTNVNWSPDWELRWWSFKGKKNRTAWVYHLRSKTSAERYTSILDPNTGQWQHWQSAW